MWARARDALFWSDLDRIIPIHWKDSNSKSLAEGFPLSLEFWPIKVIFVRRQFKVYTIYTIVCWDPLTKIQIPCQPRRTTGQLHQPASSRFTKVRRCWEIIHLHIFRISTLVHSTALDTLHMVVLHHEKSFWMSNWQLKKLCFPEIGAGQFNQLSIFHSTIRSIIFLSSQTYRRQAFHVVEAVLSSFSGFVGKSCSMLKFSISKVYLQICAPTPTPGTRSSLPLLKVVSIADVTAVSPTCHPPGKI